MDHGSPDLRYPIGPFQFDGDPTPRLAQWIEELDEAPGALRAAVSGLAPEQLDTPYRPEGWTVRQVAHHLPDSHLNAYIRCKLAVTEETPRILPYDQDRWANLGDNWITPVETSLELLAAVHRRWVDFLRSLEPTAFARGFFHPEHERVLSLGETVALYAWHGRHHVAQINALRRRRGW